MTSFRFIRLCVCLTFLCSIGPGAALGAIVAPLNGMEAIDAHGTQDLKVHNPDHEKQALKIQKAPDFVIVQGDPDTRRNVNVSASNDAEHLVADIDIPDAEAGNLLYSVEGIIIRGGGGVGGEGESGAPATWTAAYNRGDARIVLEINGTPWTDDDYVAYGDNGGILTITLAGGSSDTNYTVNLSQVPIGSPEGEVDFSSVSVALAGGASAEVSLHGRTAGYVQITAKCTDCTDVAEASMLATVVQVTFDPDTIGTGFTKPVGESTIVRSVTVSVVPPDVANIIEIVRKGPTVPEVIVQNVQTGQSPITFDVKGLRATPPAHEDGRTVINATAGGHVVGEARAIVHVPIAIHTPHPTEDGNVDPVNRNLDRDSSPVWVRELPHNHVARVTIWGHMVTVRVNDQWGNALIDPYNGASVHELFNGHWWNINQPLASNGTYQDPVGWMEHADPLLVLRDSDEANEWEPDEEDDDDDEPEPPPFLDMGSDGTEYQRIDVRVGGHDVGQVRRNVIRTRPNHIRIVDPD